ncbi:MAG: hypothetical protein AABM30_09320 [Actinomycetota bacterium]
MSDNITAADAKRLHLRAEEILTGALRAQGREPDSYSFSEYAVAHEQALAEDNMTAPKIAGLAEPAGEIAGVRYWRLDGELIDDNTLVARVERQHASENQTRELDREIGESLRGLDVHTTAMNLLADRGISDPTYDQLVSAYAEVAG